MTVVIHRAEMPRQMAKHFDCLRRTKALEIELFGVVLSESIVEQLETYSRWPFAAEPPSIAW